MEGLRNGYWFRARTPSQQGKVHVRSAYELPDELGHFRRRDCVSYCSICVIHSPYAVENCARLADTVIVTDLHHPDVPDDSPVMKWLSTPEAPSLDTWWKFSPQLFVRFGEVLGFQRRRHLSRPCSPLCRPGHAH